MPQRSDLGPLVVTTDTAPDNLSGTDGAGVIPGPVRHYVFGPAGGSVVIDRDLMVGDDACLAVAIFPVIQLDEPHGTARDRIPNYDSCRIAVQVRCGDQLFELTDQHGHQMSPDDLGCLWTDQWNWLEFDLSGLGVDHLDTVELVAASGYHGEGWFQLAGVRTHTSESPDVVRRADMRRGSHSARGFSRGNCYPITFRPHGAHFLTPLTDARSVQWPYSWHDGGTEPRLQGLGFVHAPSPWIGDRISAHVMPWIGHADVDPQGREMVFRHTEEIANPDLYQVRLIGLSNPGSVLASMTATDHCGFFRFDFETSQRCGVVVDQQGQGSTFVEELPDGRAAIYAKINPGTPRMQTETVVPSGYLYAETDQKVRVLRARSTPADSRSLHIGPIDLSQTKVGHWIGSQAAKRDQAVVLRLEDESQRLDIRAALSYISFDQARHSLALEIGTDDFDTVQAASHHIWEDLLGRLEIEGGSPGQRANAWGSLARLVAWPNAHHENRGPSQDHPSPIYASPFAERSHPDGPERTGCQTVPGQLYVNNGYWDTYRTAWPAYHLLFPETAGELVDGIVQQYRDSGWMSRWSAPGHVDCMVGTSSDTIFADASTHGIDFDELSAYDSAIKNACVPSPRRITGRRSIGRGRFIGWVDTDEHEGFSWSIENAICDAAIARWSASLAEKAAQLGVSARREEFLANHRYFTNRALSWRALYDPETGFLRGRDAEGAITGDFDPLLWGGDYTETNGWGMLFSPVHDGAGLAELLGSEQTLAERLDTALATPEPASVRTRGAYPRQLHEMLEVRALRLGQFGVSNQPGHHNAYMYLYAGHPERTQWTTREIADRLWVGNEIGQGYPGDEDNGQMSAWQLFTMMGLYPLVPGSGELVISSPVFDRMSWHRPDGTRLQVIAHDVAHRYIQRVQINGEEWNQVSVPVDKLHGECTIEFWLGPQPSEWGHDSRPIPLVDPAVDWQPDRSHDAELSVYGSGEGLPDETIIDHLVDDRGYHLVQLPAGAILQMSWSQPFTPSHFSITLDDLQPARWRLEAMVDGSWQVVDVAPIAAQWPQQTVAHRLPDTPITALRWHWDAPVNLRQLEVF